jgi:hypothetical protein
MSRKTKLKAVPTNGQDVEALAAQAKIERQKKCSEGLNKVLAAHNCQFTVLVQVGDKAVPLDQVLSLPLQLMVTSK